MTDFRYPPRPVVALLQNGDHISGAAEQTLLYPDVSFVFRSPLPFSPVVRVGNLLFVSGQASADENGIIVPDTFEGEVRRTMENLRRVLRAAGSDLSCIVQARGYLADVARWDDYNALYEQYFRPPYPARTTLVNCLPPTIQFEMDCVAVVRDPDALRAEKEKTR